MRILLAAHAVLILLASTAFTVITYWIDRSFECAFYSYSFSSGFGTPYVSDYSIPVTLTYLIAFALGIAGFAMAYRSGRVISGTLGVILAAIGFFSFSFELTHVVVNHHRSFIAIAPTAMLVLAVIACIPRRSELIEEITPAST